MRLVLAGGKLDSVLLRARLPHGAKTQSGAGMFSLPPCCIHRDRPRYAQLLARGC